VLRPRGGGIRPQRLRGHRAAHARVGVQDGRRRHQVPALPRRHAGRGAPSRPQGLRPDRARAQGMAEGPSGRARLRADRARRGFRPSVAAPRGGGKRRRVQDPLHGHGEPGLHPRGRRRAEPRFLRHRRGPRGRGPGGARPRGQRPRRPAARVPDLSHPDRGDPLPRAHGVEGSLPRAGGIPRPHRRRQRLCSRRARPRRRVRSGPGREALHPRPQREGFRLPVLAQPRGLLPDGRAAAPGRARGGRRSGRGERRRQTLPPRDGALDRGRPADPAGRGPDPRDACLQENRRALRPRVPSAQRRPRHRPPGFAPIQADETIREDMLQ